ncbi:ABC transporter permease, partial [Dysosmobacter welbionis]|uniref:ABC transporter permease n=1 Tax=Dysosmobacter welbionis TaxID=2093857 RepID=UPI003AB2A1CB
MIKRLLPYLKGYQKQAVLAPALVALETICELILPLLMAEIIDNGIANSSLPIILKMGALMLVVASVSMYCGVMASKHASFAAQGLGANLRRAEFEKLSTFSFGDIDRFSSASLITRLTNDVTNIQNMVAMALRLLVRSGVMVVASLAVALYIRWQLAIILLIIVPIVALVLAILMKVCMGLFRAMQHRLDQLNETVQENLVGIRVVKSYVREEFEKTKFKASNDAFTQAGMNVSLRIILMQPMMMIGISAATVLILYLGGQT